MPGSNSALLKRFYIVNLCVSEKLIYDVGDCALFMTAVYENENNFYVPDAYFQADAEIGMA